MLDMKINEEKPQPKKKVTQNTSKNAMNSLSNKLTSLSIDDL